MGGILKSHETGGLRAAAVNEFALDRHTRLLAGSAVVALSVMLGTVPSGRVNAGDKAVAQPNAKIAGHGGRVDGDIAGFAEGSVSFNLSGNLGMQLDAGGGDFGDETGFAFGGHLFWRDPERFLIGGVVSFARVTEPGATITRIGAEAEYYWGDITLKASGGGQLSSEDAFDGGFFTGQIAYYPVDNLVFKAGGQVASGVGNSFATFGVEYQVDNNLIPGIALFAEGAYGQEDFTALLAGVRIYIGAERKSLKRRHREDDPEGLGVPLIGAATSAGNLANEKNSLVVPPPSTGGGMMMPGCWVARAVYGADNPRWRMFRAWLFADAPEWFRNMYLRHGEAFAAWIDNKPRLKDLIRLWMDSRIRARQAALAV